MPPRRSDDSVFSNAPSSTAGQPPTHTAIAPGQEVVHKPRTRKAYSSDWKHYSAWCEKRGFEPETATGAIIAAYLEDIATPKQGGPLAASTISRRFATISWQLRAMGMTPDVGNPELKATLLKLRRLRRAKPANLPRVQTADIAAVISRLNLRNLWQIRNRAIVLLGAVTKLTSVQIASLHIGNIPPEDPGVNGLVRIQNDGLEITLCDKAGGIRLVHVPRAPVAALCPAGAVQTWLHFAKLSEGLLFRPIGEGQQVMDAGLRPDYVRRILMRSLDRAGASGAPSESES